MSFAIKPKQIEHSRSSFISLFEKTELSDGFGLEVDLIINFLGRDLFPFYT